MPAQQAGADGRSHAGQWPVPTPLLPTHPHRPCTGPSATLLTCAWAGSPCPRESLTMPPLHQSSFITKDQLWLSCPLSKSTTKVGPAMGQRPQQVTPAHCSEQGEPGCPDSKDVDQQSICMGANPPSPFRTRKEEPFLQVGTGL